MNYVNMPTKNILLGPLPRPCGHSPNSWALLGTLKHPRETDSYTPKTPPRRAAHLRGLRLWTRASTAEATSPAGSCLGNFLSPSLPEPPSARAAMPSGLQSLHLLGPLTLWPGQPSRPAAQLPAGPFLPSAYPPSPWQDDSASTLG